jgi:hypothetical protein
MSEVIVKYKNAEYTVYLKKLTRREKSRVRFAKILEDGTRIIEPDLIDYEATKMAISSIIGKSQGVDLLSSITKDEFLDNISDEDFVKIVDESDKLNFSKTTKDTSKEETQ